MLQKRMSSQLSTAAARLRDSPVDRFENDPQYGIGVVKGTPGPVWAAASEYDAAIDGVTAEQRPKQAMATPMDGCDGDDGLAEFITAYHAKK
jgi:hypothetical protein